MSPVISLISLLKLHSFTGQVYALTFFFGNLSFFLKRTLEISFTQQVTGLLFAEQLASLQLHIYPAMLQRHDLEVWTVWSSRMNTMNALLAVAAPLPARWPVHSMLLP